MAARAVAVPMKNFAARSVAFNEIRDVAEVNIMRAWLAVVGAGAVYSASQQLFSSRAGSFLNVNTRGDIYKQMAVAEEAARTEGRILAGTTPATGSAQSQHTWWWRLAHVMD